MRKRKIDKRHTLQCNREIASEVNSRGLFFYFCPFLPFVHSGPVSVEKSKAGASYAHTYAFNTAFTSSSTACLSLRNSHRVKFGYINLITHLNRQSTFHYNIVTCKTTIKHSPCGSFAAFKGDLTWLAVTHSSPRPLHLLDQYSSLCIHFAPVCLADCNKQLCLCLWSPKLQKNHFFPLGKPARQSHIWSIHAASARMTAKGTTWWKPAHVPPAPRR